MKVLMFGWEFPPQISGGLGTACYGLTHSLSRNSVEVLFVVPKLHGGESAERTAFLSASSIPVPQYDPSKLFPQSAFGPSVKQELASVIKAEENVTTIAVPAALSPYRSPSGEDRLSPVQSWNYSWQRQRRVTTRTIEQDPEKQAEADDRGGSHPYHFSGTYGPNLMDEVRRYAQVATTIAQQNEFDVIHAHDWMTFLAGIAAKQVSGKPLVVHIHATEYDRSGEHVHPGVHAIEKQGLATADRVIAVSHWTKKIASQRYGVSPEKIEVVHNGIFPRANVSGASPLPKFGKHLVTFLGRVTHQKGPLYFVEAARLVNKCMPGTHFVVAGAGDMLPLMVERIAQLRMSSVIHFTGFLTGADLDRVWAMSSVYVMPSVSEPFGIAPLEAIQAGVPVIISNQSGVAEVMPHAIKVDFWNVSALAASICSVLKYKSLSASLRQNGAAEIQNITWNKAADKITKLYHGLAIEQRKA